MKRGSNKQAPARVVASSPRYLELSKKLMSDALAEFERCDAGDLGAKRHAGTGLGMRERDDFGNRQGASVG